MPIIAMGHGSAHGFEFPFTICESLSDGTLAGPEIDCGAIEPVKPYVREAICREAGLKRSL